jgi:hypothetical protein
LFRLLLMAKHQSESSDMQNDGEIGVAILNMRHANKET